MKTRTYDEVLVYFQDMATFATQASESLENVTVEQMRADWRISYLTCRAMELLGEATRRIPEPVKREFPNIPRKIMIRLRNILAHEYGIIHIPTLYATVKEDVPPLQEELAKAIMLISERGSHSIPSSGDAEAGTE